MTKTMMIVVRSLVQPVTIRKANMKQPLQLPSTVPRRRFIIYLSVSLSHSQYFKGAIRV